MNQEIRLTVLFSIPISFNKQVSDHILEVMCLFFFFFFLFSGSEFAYRLITIKDTINRSTSEE